MRVCDIMIEVRLSFLSNPPHTNDKNSREQKGWADEEAVWNLILFQESLPW